jgi:hypothetical protein
VHRALVRRVGTAIRTGKLPPAAGSITRLSNGLNSVRLASIALEIAGDRAVAWEEGDPAADTGIAYIARQGVCLGGGSTEMARNLISERVLGMPRERAEDIGVPFRDVQKNAMSSRR